MACATEWRMGNYVTEDGWIRCRVKEVERNPVTEEGIGEEEIELKDLWKTRKYVREKTRIYDTPKHLSHALELWCLSMITSDVKYKGVNSYTHTTSSTQKRRTHTHTYTQYTKKSKTEISMNSLCIIQWMTCIIKRLYGGVAIYHENIKMIVNEMFPRITVGFLLIQTLYSYCYYGS